jgi:putative ABC transport system permease protein
MRSLGGLAARNLTAHPLRAALAALAVSLSVAMTLAAAYVSAALLATLVNAGEGDLQVTHGFVVEQFDQLLAVVRYALAGAALFLVFNAFAMTVSERQRQIGALRALGMTRRQVRRGLLLEALLLGSVGTILGLAMGPLLGRLIVAIMGHYGGLFVAFGQGSISAGMMVTAAAMGLGVTMLAMLLPARRAMLVPPLLAIRPQAEGGVVPPSRRLTLLGGGTALLLFAALALAPPGDWLAAPGNFVLTVLLVMVWLGCLGLLLPWLIALAGRATRRWLGRHSAQGRLIGDNVQRDRGRVSLTVLTLAVGLATITGLNGFMTFAFDDLLGASMRRIAADGTWAVFPFNLDEGLAGLAGLDVLALPPPVIAEVEAMAGERATVAAFRFALIPELSFLGENYFSFVVKPETLRTQPALFRFDAGEREAAVAVLEEGCGALLLPAVAARYGARVGDTITITGIDGPLTCTVAGIGSGYVNASIVSSAVADKVGATAPIGLTVRPQPGTDGSMLEADLEALEAAHPGVWVTSMTDFAALQRDAIGLFAVAVNGMLLLAVVVAALGVVNTTMMSVQERRQELGLLRAVGATRRQVRLVVMGENALMGLLGGLVGVAAGMGSVVIIVTTFGGRSWGVNDLALWPAAGRALLPTLSNALVALIAAPLLSAVAARGPLRRLLQGTAADTQYANGRGVT